jgi:hypothetical protein
VDILQDEYADEEVSTVMQLVSAGSDAPDLPVTSTFNVAVEVRDRRQVKLSS